MSVQSRIYVAGGVGLLTSLISFETLHLLGMGGGFYILVVILVTGAFYSYAYSFRCPHCKARLFPPSRLSTPFVPKCCLGCGRDISP